MTSRRPPVGAPFYSQPKAHGVIPRREASRALLMRSPATWSGDPSVRSVATYSGSTKFWMPLRSLVAAYGDLGMHEVDRRKQTLDALARAIEAWRANQARNWWDSATDKAKAALVRQVETLTHAERVDLGRTEDARATGEAGTALERGRTNAASRAASDHDAALERLQRDAGVPASEAEEILRKCLDVLAQAPLTVNFALRKLPLILSAGGLKNYWQLTPALTEPEASASDEDKLKYRYQQERLEGEHRLFGGTADLTVKNRQAAEQPISSAANVTGYRLGAAPTSDYGFSVIVLRERVKRRATYTPFDALDLMKRRRAGEALAGPEVVGTHGNLAAVIRYAPTDALRDIVKNAKAPGAYSGTPMPNYIEAQIHGPVTLGDIERITISLEDLDAEAYDALRAVTGTRPADDAVKREIARRRREIEQSLAAHGIPVEFTTLA